MFFKKKANDRDKEIRKVTFVGFIVNILLSVFKIAAGIFGKSEAMTADGIHSLSDTITDIAVIIGSFYWSKPADQNHQYGHKRLETVITLFISFILLSTAVWIALKAILSFKHVEYIQPSPVALAAAALSIVFKELLYRWTAKIGKKNKSMSLIANAWHHRLDSFSSIPVLIAIAGSIIFPELTFLDHIGAVFVSALIFIAGLKILFSSINELSDIGAPEKICGEIQEIAYSHPSVFKVNEVKTRYMGSSLLVNLNLVLNGNLSLFEAHKISEDIKIKLLKEGPDIVEVQIQILPE